jgi:hypothetical protein
VDDFGPRGYELEIPGGWIFEIGNEWITRRIQCIGERIGTTSLSHSVSGEEYLEATVEEFALVLSRDGEQRELSFRDFYYIGHSLPQIGSEERSLKIDLAADFENSKLPLSVIYRVRAGENVIQKWIEIPSVNLPGWMIEWVTLENLRFKATVEGVTPYSRYPQKFLNEEDNPHVESDKVSVDEPDKRFQFGDRARAIVQHWGLDEGLFFFTANILGTEDFNRPDGLLMRQKDYIPLTNGLTTGEAVVGAYSGPPEIGFKRYTEFLTRNWCVVDDKPMPVSWNTWFVTLKNNMPLLTVYDRNLLVDYLELLNNAGFYDILHLDLGWEARWPLEVNRDKFPKGLDEIVLRSRNCGFDMGYWINPFSSSYWKSDVEEEHQEWLNPDKVSGNSHAHAICPMTEYFDYVKRRMLELATRYNARVIYWDGGDWNIPECKATNHEHRSQHELEVKATKRLMELAEAVHEANPETMFVNFSLPFNNHRLSVLDQEQVSDTHYLPIGKSELSQRQQFYQMTFEHPYRAIWSSWYGIDWHESGKDNQRRPLRELIYAEMSMIGNGVCQAGASLDLMQARPEFLEFLKRMFAWRKRFESYFTVYQHILGFPDGENVDGEGHIFDEKGFLVLVNPTEVEKSVNLPLDEPELELSVGKKYRIYDWSNFESARFLQIAAVRDKIELDFSPLEVKIIGIDIGE